jgi:nucleotide-binding universal stress UspA family protein
MFKRIAVAVDGSATSNRGLLAAIGLAADQQATLLILHVVDDLLTTAASQGDSYVSQAYTESLLANIREGGRRILAKAQAQARKAGLEPVAALVETRGRTIAEAVVAEARKLRADIIVLGTHGRRGLRRMVMGSDAEAVVRDARVPVMLIRHEGTSGATDRKPATKSKVRPATAAKASAESISR